MMYGSLATFGYANKETLPQLQAAMRVNLRAVIVDTRLTPHCNWSPLWQRRALEIAWGDRYRYKGEVLGNVNHRHPELSIQLAHEEEGITWIVGKLEEGTTLVLLCGCARYEKCHRKVIYEKVRARIGHHLPEYALGQRVLTSRGTGIIDPAIPLDVHRTRNRYEVLLDHPIPQRFFSPHELQPYSVTQQAL